jgi:predicted nuclease of restriction endonuclease-like (RecB) superfamily
LRKLLNVYLTTLYKIFLKPKKPKYTQLLDNIGATLQHARENAYKAINTELVKANWEIGKHIVEFEQAGKERAEYGAELLVKLSTDLKTKYGKGFSRSNLQLMRLFYIKYPKFQTLSGKSSIRQTPSGKSEKRQTPSGIFLSWSHYAELLTVSDDMARSFYEKQAIKENWSFREMKRQIDSALFQRLALSKDKKGVLALAEKGHELISVKDAIKDPYVFEFLELSKDSIIKERGLEKKLVDNLQKFLLELGKGFSFVAKQFKITLDNEHYFIDLVFYHRILKCFVLIDLKTKKVKHQDIGQMNLYLNYFKTEENTAGDNEPIGIIIAADKHDLLVQYATGGLSNKIFVSKYQMYLPDQKMLEKKVQELIDNG